MYNAILRNLLGHLSSFVMLLGHTLFLGAVFSLPTTPHPQDSEHTIIAGGTYDDRCQFIVDIFPIHYFLKFSIVVYVL